LVLIRFGGVFFLLMVVLWLWALFDSITTDQARVRNLPKVAWVIIVLLFFEVGALAWIFLGRPTGRGQAGRASGFGLPGRGPQPRPSGPVGPDDDPDFLGKI